MERVALNRPPIFNGDNYVHWNMRMRTYIMSHDLKAWLVIMNGRTYIRSHDLKA